MSQLTVTQFDDFNTLPAELIDTWHRLSINQPFMSLEWFRNFTDNVVEDSTSFVLAVSNDEGLFVGILPLRREVRGKLKTKYIHSLTNYYSPIYSYLIDESFSSATQISECISNFFLTFQINWDVLDFSPLHVNNSLTALITAFNKTGCSSSQYHATVNWYQPVNSYSEYIDSRPSRLINTINRKGRKLGKDYKAQFELIYDSNEIARGIDLYQQVYEASWKRPEPFPRFIPGLLKQSAELGWLRLGILSLDNEPVAVQLWLVVGKTAYIYKLAYHPEFSKYSVGTLLTNWLMEQIIEKYGVSKIDFLTGNDTYKQDWMDKRKDMYGLQVVNTNSIKGYLLYIKEVIASFLKRKARK